MDKELIERLAREAGCDILDADGFAADHWVHRFAELIAARSVARRKSPKAAGDGVAILGLRPEEQANASITELGMSQRVTTTLLDAGVKTVAQARDASAQGISLPGFGRKAANELRRAIERLDGSHGASSTGLREDGSANRAPNVLTAR